MKEDPDSVKLYGTDPDSVLDPQLMLTRFLAYFAWQRMSAVVSWSTSTGRSDVPGFLWTRSTSNKDSR